MAVYFLLEFIGFTEHLCLITASTAVYALINQGSFAEMILTVMNLSVGISTSQTQIMKQNCPIWPLSESQIPAGSCLLRRDKGHCVQQEWAIEGCAVSDSGEWSHLWAFIIIITFISHAARTQPALPPSLCVLASCLDWFLQLLWRAVGWLLLRNWFHQLHQLLECCYWSLSLCYLKKKNLNMYCLERAKTSKVCCMLVVNEQI